MGAPERREREKKGRKAAILDAARNILLEKGLASATVGTIAKRSEFSVGTIYLYYENKESIFADLQIEGLGLLCAMIKEALDLSATPEEKIKKAGMAYVDFSNKHSQYFNILNYFISSPGLLFTPELKNSIDRKGKEVLMLIEETIAEGIDKKIFRETADAVKTALIFWVSIHGLIQVKKMGGTFFPSDSFSGLMEYHLDNFIDNLRR